MMPLPSPLGPASSGRVRCPPGNARRLPWCPARALASRASAMCAVPSRDRTPLREPRQKLTPLKPFLSHRQVLDDPVQRGRIGGVPQRGEVGPAVDVLDLQAAVRLDPFFARAHPEHALAGFPHRFHEVPGVRRGLAPATSPVAAASRPNAYRWMLCSVTSRRCDSRRVPRRLCLRPRPVRRRPPSGSNGRARGRLRGRPRSPSVRRGGRAPVPPTPCCRRRWSVRWRSHRRASRGVGA